MKNKFPVITGKTGQNAEIAVFDSAQIPLPKKSGQVPPLKGGILSHNYCILISKLSHCLIVSLPHSQIPKISKSSNSLSACHEIFPTFERKLNKNISS